jgi:hypothetical protein
LVVNGELSALGVIVRVLVALKKTTVMSLCGRGSNFWALKPNNKGILLMELVEESLVARGGVLSAHERNQKVSVL